MSKHFAIILTILAVVVAIIAGTFYAVATSPTSSVPKTHACNVNLAGLDYIKLATNRGVWVDANGSIIAYSHQEDSPTYCN